PTRPDVVRGTVSRRRGGGGGGGGGAEPVPPRSVPPEPVPPHAVSAARTSAAKPHRVMLRIRDLILIPSLVIDANGAAHCARAATAGEHCTQMHSNPSSTWIDRVVCCHLGICRAK